ncbi:glycosyltransferase family A protein [Parasphingorhabdus sp.]|uniref:glycosyltransferase family A protein n=1 Tax=Parasphingorhabdus sp. TaxID=2709688 RepID=UPI003D2AA21B
MKKISVILSAEHGIDDCQFLDFYENQQDRGIIEIIIVDGGPNFIDQSNGIIRHIQGSSSNIQSLIATGLPYAQGEWIFISEDHCRPLEGIFDGYQLEIANHPEIDLFGGLVENLTSTGLWSTAIFLTGLGAHWVSAPTLPQSPTNANMMIRAAAILSEEMVVDGGLLNFTIPRLIAAQKYALCPAAVVDHVLPLSPKDAISFQFHVSTDVVSVNRALWSNPLTFRRFLGDGLNLLRKGVFDPIRIVRLYKGSLLGRMSMAGRLMAIGITGAMAVLHYDVSLVSRRLSR